MADAGRCLSDLSDDLLRHILFMAPDRDGAATAVLSRRWRWLWRTSGAVYLDSRPFNSSRNQPGRAAHAEKALAEKEREAFFRGAEKALAAAAAHGRIRRLTFFIAEDSKIDLLWRYNLQERWCREEHNLIETLLSNPAARLVEELHIVVTPLNTRSKLSFGSLPSEALRVLRVIGRSSLTAGPPPHWFPMLVDLHLQDCSVPLVDLQSIIDASPRLSTLHLESSNFSFHDEQLVGRLLIPAVSALVLADCRYGSGYMNSASLELDVPRLRCFRYRGHVEDTNRLSLKSQASTIHVDLHLTHDSKCYGYGRPPNPTPTRELFWRFLQNFNTAKLLKLRIDDFTMDDLALVNKVRRDELLGGFSLSLVEQLELEAEYKAGDTTSMLMLADLLHCCPMVRDLCIKLTKKNQWHWSDSPTPDMVARQRFEKSVSAFTNRRKRPMVSLAGQNDDSFEAFGIPGLTGEHSFSCLQNRLKRVSLQFFRDGSNCLGVQLAKFFAENAMVLQEIHIDDGCHEMLENVNPIIRRWIAKTDKGNNQLRVKD